MDVRRSLLPVAALIATTAYVGLSAPAYAGPPPLTWGSHGPAVRALQHRLADLGYLAARGAVTGDFGERTWHAVIAFQGWRKLPRTGVVGPGTRTALATAVRPRPWKQLPRALELDLSRQVLLVVAHGRTVRAIHVSTARPGMVTPRGSFHVYRRELMSWSVPYSAWMPYSLYFSGGYAIHGYPDVPPYPASHGCVRMPMLEAPWVYAVTPIGTPVLVR